jgi:hypothetical protein
VELVLGRKIVNPFLLGKALRSAVRFSSTQPAGDDRAGEASALDLMVEPSLLDLVMSVTR